MPNRFDFLGNDIREGDLCVIIKNQHNQPCFIKATIVKLYENNTCIVVYTDTYTRVVNVKLVKDKNIIVLL